jgi:hypothetical protein
MRRRIELAKGNGYELEPADAERLISEARIGASHSEFRKGWPTIDRT